MPKALMLLFIHTKSLTSLHYRFGKVAVAFIVGFTIRLLLVVSTEQVQYIN
jgi:hypothetical protein